MGGVKKIYPTAKGAEGAERIGPGLELAAVGIEAEFNVVLDGEPVRPEDLFGDPRAFVRGGLVHRKGRSYNIPTGGALYFDTGVIEVATPVIEIERGAAARAGRSLWEAILFVRTELDAWERRTGNDVRLAGYSAHYNVSFDVPRAAQGRARTVARLAKLLSYILPAPVMLLATNRRSSGVGVRPRGDRIEVTVDFTPSASLTIATATLVTGIVREVMKWPSYDLAVVDEMGLPVICGFEPMPHTTRKGWLARFDCYPRNPFEAGPDEPLWELRESYWAGRAPELVPLRRIAAAIFARFWRPIARVADPFTFRLIASVLGGRAPSLLDLPDRPEAYEDVGRLCRWDNLFSERVLARSRYERVLMRAISGRKLRMGAGTFTPTGMRGWTVVSLREDATGREFLVSVDSLVGRLGDWERGAAPARRRRV